MGGKAFFLGFFLILIPNFKSIERPLEAFLHWKQMVCPEIIGGVLTFWTMLCGHDGEERDHISLKIIN